VGVMSRPSLSAGEAKALAADRWGIRGGASPLPGERDQNFLIEAGGRRYVLKVANAAEDRAVLDMQNRAMERVHAAGLPCSHPVQDRVGDEIAEHRGYLVRRVGYLDGRPLAAIHPRPGELLRDLGRTMGGVDRALEGFEHPSTGRELYWDVRHAERVIGERLNGIPRPGGRDLVRRALDRFASAVGPFPGELRTGVIHNDANDHNVLVDEQACRVTGLLDFGDMVRTIVVNEAAVACAYAMLGEAEPVASAREVVGGYQEVAPLDPHELATLFDLIRIRLATSVCVAAHQHTLRPDDPYLTVSEDQAWSLLERLDRFDPDAAETAFLDPA
jgi:Ser/Thr protein kinase RdoA (MazF antagonist)